MTIFDVVFLAFLGGRAAHERTQCLGDFALLADDLAHVRFFQQHDDLRRVVLFLDAVFDLVFILGKLLYNIFYEF